MENYNYIDILLNLREEYLKNQLELAKLKEYIELDDSKVEEYFFRCVATQKLVPDILFDRKIKVSGLEKIRQFITKAIDLTSADNCIKLANGDYTVKSKIHLKPTIINQQEFNRQMEKIVHSDFALNALNFIDNNGSYIHCHFDGISFFNSKLNCWYSARRDLFTAQARITKVTEELLLELFNTQVKASKFNEWQQNVLKTNNIHINEIGFQNMRKKDHLGLTISNEKNKVLLKRI